MIFFSTRQDQKRIGNLFRVAWAALLSTGLLGGGWANAAEELPSLPKVTFLPMEDSTIPWEAWGEVTESKFSFMYDRVGDPQGDPQRILVLFPGDATSPCYLEPSLRTAAATHPTVLIQPILAPTETLQCGAEDPLLDLCRSLCLQFGIPPERIILVGEGDRTETVLALASNHRSEIGGVIAWEGSAGSALPANLNQTSIALLGNREKQGGFTHFLEQASGFEVPIKMNSYWGDLEEYELTDDLGEILDWMAQPERKEVGREISHSAYLPRYGKYGWIWITQLLSPGLPGSVWAHWTKTGKVEFKVEGVKRFRVKIDSTFDRFGRRVDFSVGNLNLPITLNRDMEAIEFEYLPDKDQWNATFLGFDLPISPEIIAAKRTEEYRSGQDIPAFAAFTRIETESECAWGNRFPRAIPKEALTDEQLYCLVPPIHYVRLNWSLQEIEAFDTWQKARDEFGFEISFAPGVQSNARDKAQPSVQCLLPFPVLERYSREQSISLPTDLQVVDNLQHLLGRYLSREHVPASASL